VTDVAAAAVQQRRQSSDIHLFFMYATSSGDVTRSFETLPEDGHNMLGT
jgi:hypothetical protein